MRFEKGKSGNPAGKKAGSGKLQKLRASMEADIPAILDTLITQAKAGDPVSARLILERTLPSLKPESRSPTPAPTSPDAITAALENGSITIDQGTALMGIASMKVKLQEGQELLDRLTALETMIATMGRTA